MSDKENLLKELPPFQGYKQLIAPRQSVKDIMQEVVDAHNFYRDDYDRIAGQFLQGGTYDIEKRLFDWCKQNLKYKEEPEKDQTLRSPGAILVMDEISGVDCKHYASFIGGVLDAINRTGDKYFDWSYRFASYDAANKTPEHVFVIVRYLDDEVWIDPVVSGFDVRYPYPKYFKDRKVKTMSLSRVSGLGKTREINSVNIVRTGSGNGSGDCGCGCVGAITTSQLGGYIMSVAPALAAVPVVGWAAAVGGELIGGFLKIFGNKYQTSTSVRWLTQLYEYYVIGLPTKSDNQVNEANVPGAQRWFSYVLGIPIYDRYRFNSIKGSTGFSAVDNSITTRVKDYLKYPDTQNVDPAIATEAAGVANLLNFASPQGGWKGMTAAPWLIVDSTSGKVVANQSAPNAVVVSPIANTTQGLSAWIRQNPLLALGIAGVGIYGLSKVLK
jgi:hypothetical protein